jgi:hypothetical protein
LVLAQYLHLLGILPRFETYLLFYFKKTWIFNVDVSGLDSKISVFSDLIIFKSFETQDALSFSRQIQ